MHTFQVGALEACVMAQNGFEVHLFEYRKGNMRTNIKTQQKM